MDGIHTKLDEAKYNVVHDYPRWHPAAKPSGAAGLGPLVNIKPNVLSNKVNPTIDTHHLMVDEAVAIQHQAKDYRILYAEASMLGHVCILTGTYEGITDIELLNAYAKLHKEMGDLAQAINDALLDKRVTRKELNRISSEMDEAVRAMYELRARLEAIADE